MPAHKRGASGEAKKVIIYCYVMRACCRNRARTSQLDIALGQDATVGLTRPGIPMYTSHMLWDVFF